MFDYHRLICARIVELRLIAYDGTIYEFDSTGIYDYEIMDKNGCIIQNLYFDLAIISPAKNYTILEICEGIAISFEDQVFEFDSSGIYTYSTANTPIRQYAKQFNLTTIPTIDFSFFSILRGTTQNLYKMKKILLFACLCIVTIQYSTAQEVISSTFLTSYELEYFTEELEISFSKNGVDLYRVNYTTTNLEGALDTASGLLCIPILPGYNLPLVSYGHGTVGSRYDVPSYLSEEHNLPAIYSSVGTVTVAPDYLGLGDNDGVHPYVHADSEAWASYDLIVAVQSFLPQEMDINLNDQLFITGYSQGGHSAMALHRYIETETDIEVTGALPMSGPYSISTGMKDLLVSEDDYAYVAYLAATAISYQEVYGNIYPNNDITQFFKQPYADIILKYKNEEADLFEVNEELIDALIDNEGAAMPKKMIFDDIVNAILSEENHPVNIALRDNDVYDWTPKTDTRLLYCQGDDQVAFENSIIARDKMIENGAQMVQAIDLNPNFNHTECVTPAATSFVFFLLVFAEVTSTYETPEISFNVYPNPSKEGFYLAIDDLNTEFSVELHNMSGVKQMTRNNITSGSYIDTNLPSGMYILSIKTKEGKPLGFQRIVIM